MPIECSQVLDLLARGASLLGLRKLLNYLPIDLDCAFKPHPKVQILRLTKHLLGPHEESVTSGGRSRWIGTGPSLAGGQLCESGGVLASCRAVRHHYHCTTAA